ncbi:MAG TPA: c-type cytochrome [Quisquiliibacterium sp.]|nr:c-type cytochrome [Quisquiliibacterium sp.]
MSRSTDSFRLSSLLAAACIALAPAAAQAQSRAVSAKPAAQAPAPWRDVGRPATPDEIAAWDIDVRADFKGLPPGSGSVLKGQEVWEAKCASCHGVFGESTEVFTPIVGGTTKQDVVTGRVANLTRPDYPQRTTMMKLSQVSTLWDYINRAMPWNAPKSLSVEEVYAVTAYILNLADVIPEDYVLSDRNIAEVQKRLPNRNGKLVYQEMWKVAGKPDVQGLTCMKDCPVESDLRSTLPEFARNAHGNLAEQNRVVGPFRGADTTKPPSTEPARLASAASTAAAVTQVHVGRGTALKPPLEIAKDAACLACHSVERKLVGPSFREIAGRYRGDAKAGELIALKVRNGGQGAWGAVPMPANPQLKDEDLRSLVKWILAQ